jgi:hypothetical protein
VEQDEISTFVFTNYKIEFNEINWIYLVGNMHLVLREILYRQNELCQNFVEVIRPRGSVVVKALCCKPEGRGFKSRIGGFLKLT